MPSNFIGKTIDRALNAAGLVPATGQGVDLRNLIDRALSAAGVGSLPGVLHRERPAAAPPLSPRPGWWSAPASASASARVQTPSLGEFVALSHAGKQGSRDYKLYVPTAYAPGRAMPLLVMLHGCKQNPDDFAAGTRMNEHAERHGFLVAYPAQAARANGANCWNWFETAQQQREGAEPALLAGIVADIARSHAVRTDQVYVAGLSAGAAMAVILGSSYPEVFAGVAAHSGLPLGAANGVGSAFTAMREGVATKPEGARRLPPVRTIVIHGDADATVSPRNGDAITQQAVAAFEGHGERLRRRVYDELQVGGRPSTLTGYDDESGRCVVEEWVVHGAGHAWSGGSAEGSFTDALGLDASEAIVRFLMKQG